MPHKIGLYIRVSTEEQAMRVEGSLDSQKHRLQGFVDIKNMQQSGWGSIVDTYVDDGFSAKDTNRPALQRLLRDLKIGRIDMVLVTDLSRLSRSIRDFCVLLDVFKDTKAKFLSLKEQFDTTTAAGEMMLFNMMNLAQFERRQISERVTLNFHSRALRGLRNGGAPTLGFMVDPTNKAVLQVNQEEVGYVKTVFNLYLQNGSLFQTAAKLRELRVPCRARFSKNGGEPESSWNVQTTANLLRNYHYVGLREVNKGNKTEPQDDLKPHEKYQVVKAAWPAIIDEATFFTAQKMMDENSKLERVRLADRERRAFLATGVIECPDCGRALVGSTARGRSTEVRYYIHRPIEGRKVTCPIKYFRADLIEDAVTNHLLTVVSREGYLAGVERTLMEIYESKSESIQSLKRDLEGKVAQADSDIKKLIRIQIQTDDEQLREIYSSQLKEMKDQRVLDADQLEKVKLTLESATVPANMIKTVAANLAAFQKAWAKSPPALQKKLLRAVIERLVPREDGIEIYYHSDQADLLAVQGGSNAESTGTSPVDLAATRTAKNKKAPGSPRLSHNAIIPGSYDLKIGCGGRI